MTCRDVDALLSDYLTGELPHTERELFVRHRAACASCASYLDSYRTTIALARAAERDTLADVPEPLVRAILEARRARWE